MDFAGIIPAYAGSTFSSFPFGVPGGDHPRIRGEHPQKEAGRRHAVGSSPHTRGAQLPQFTVLIGPRIIPAYAGSTPLLSVGGLGRKDHPRIRGEHSNKSL